MATTEGGCSLELLKATSNSPTTPASPPGEQDEQKLKLERQRQQRNEAKRRFMNENFSPEPRPFEPRKSLSNPLSAPVPRTPPATPRPTTTVISVTTQRSASPPPLPTSAPPPPPPPPADSDPKTSSNLSGEHKESDVVESGPGYTSQPSPVEVISAASSSEVIYTIENDAFVQVEHADSSLHRPPTPPTPPSIYDGDKDPFSTDFEDNISTDLSRDTVEDNPLEREEGHSSSDTNLADSSADEDSDRACKQVNQLGEDVEEEEEEEDVEKGREEQEKDLRSIDIDGPEPVIYENTLIGTKQQQKQREEEEVKGDLQEGVIDVDEAVICDKEDPIEDNNIDQLVKEKEEEELEDQKVAENDSSVYFESSGIINISSTSTENREAYNDSAGSSDDRLVDVALTFEPENDFIDCLVDEELDPGEGEDQEEEERGEEEDFGLSVRSNSPVCIEQLDTTSEIKEDNIPDKEEEVIKKKELLSSEDRAVLTEYDPNSSAEKQLKQEESPDLIRGVEIVEEERLSEPEDCSRRLSQEGRVSFLEEQSEEEYNPEIEDDQTSIRNRVTEVEVQEIEDQISEIDDPTVESPQEEDKQLPKEDPIFNPQEEIVELDDNKDNNLSIHPHKSVSFENSLPEKDSESENLEKEYKQEPIPEKTKHPIFVPATNHTTKSAPQKEESVVTPKDKLTKKPEEVKQSSNLDFLFPDISNLCMKVNMRKPEPPRPLDASVFTPPSYRRSRSFDVEPRDVSSDEEEIKTPETPINIRDYTIASASKANGQANCQTRPHLDNNDPSRKSLTKRAPPPLMKKPSIDETAAILEASRRPNGQRPCSLQPTSNGHAASSSSHDYVNNTPLPATSATSRPQSTSALLNREVRSASKPAFTEDAESMMMAAKRRPQPLEKQTTTTTATVTNGNPAVANVNNTNIRSEFTVKKPDAEIEVDEDGKMKIFTKQQSIFMNTDQYSPELIVKSPAPILDKSATFTGFFNQAPRERVVSPTVPSPMTATPPTPHRLLATPPTTHRQLQSATTGGGPPSPLSSGPRVSGAPTATSTPHGSKKGPAPLPPVRHSELTTVNHAPSGLSPGDQRSISDSASVSSKGRHFDFSSPTNQRTESLCSSISDRALSPCLTVSSTSEPRPMTPRSQSSGSQRPRYCPPSPPRHAHTSSAVVNAPSPVGVTSPTSEDYLEVNVRQAEELQATRNQQQAMVRCQGVAESDSGCFVASPDQHNMNSLHSMNSDLDDVSRDLDTPTAGLEEGDSYFSEDSSLRRNHAGAGLDQPPSSAPHPTEYSTDTITRHQTDSDTRYETVSELLISERSYVDRLHFLCRVVVLNLKVLSKLPGEMSSLPYDIIEKTFPCVETIFNFHACTLLPRLEDRILEWKKESFVNDLMNHLCKILPTYQKFVAKVNQSLKNLDLYRNTNIVFAKLMEESEKIAECRRLPIKQHLLDITNRVSMYRDFLLEYQRNTQQDDIEEPLKELTEMSHSISRFMGKEDRLLALQNMQKRLDTDVNFATPNNELIKEGFLKSVSSQGNKRAPRYVFLLSEALLLCTTAGTISNKHQIKCIAIVDGLQIFGGDNLMLANTFYVQGRRHTIELQASSAEQKHEWIMRIREMIDAYTAKKLCSTVNVNFQVRPEEVGKYKPDKATTLRVSSCTLCGLQFRSTRRKHHCKACGQIICANCCCQKARLEYCEFRLSKVCDECYVIIRKVELTAGSDLWSDKAVQAYDQGAMSGYVQLSYNNGHSWVKRWMTVHRDRILYCFKTDSDEKPFTTLPIRRFQVAITTKDDSVHKNNSFKIFNMKRTYFLVTEDSKSLLSWLKILNDLQESTHDC